MTTTTTETSDLTAARSKLNAAVQAHKAGDDQMRDVFLRQAAIRFTAAGRPDMASYCVKLAGTPA